MIGRKLGEGRHSPKVRSVGILLRDARGWPDSARKMLEHSRALASSGEELRMKISRRQILLSRRSRCSITCACKHLFTLRIDDVLSMRQSEPTVTCACGQTPKPPAILRSRLDDSIFYSAQRRAFRARASWRIRKPARADVVQKLPRFACRPEPGPSPRLPFLPPSRLSFAVTLRGVPCLPLPCVCCAVPLRLVWTRPHQCSSSRPRALSRLCFYC